MENYYTENYTFTGFMPSGNSCNWYYDANKRTAFVTSDTVKFWTKEPKVGDKITLAKAFGSHTVMEAFINNQKVYQLTPNIQAQKDKDQQEIVSAAISLFHNKQQTK